MRRLVRAGWMAWCVVAGLSGCASVAPLENPSLIIPNDCASDNSVAIQTGLPTPEGYREIYDRTLDALDDYFEVKPASRYSGQIETLPRIAPGYEQPWKPGSPNPRERLLATYQTIRHYAIVQIWAGERGGYRVYVEVYKELEDLSRPAAARSGAAAFQEAQTVDRRVDVVAVQAKDTTWIPAGREPALEQAILRKIQQRRP